MEFLNLLLSNTSQLVFWGYATSFFAAFLESLVFIGVVIPGSTLVVLSGFVSSQGYVSLWGLIFFTTMGAILGDSLSYYLGTKGTRFFHNENKLLKVEHLDRGRQFFQRYGSKSIFLSRFIAPLRAIVPFIAGISGMGKKTFLFWNILSAFIWSTTHILLGYFFGNSLPVIKIWLTNIGYVLGGLIIFFVAIYIMRCILKKYHKIDGAVL